jgi:rhodanese-related sulfurtransferase
LVVWNGRAAEAAHAAQSGADIYDVRSHAYFDIKAMRIRGSHRLDPHSCISRTRSSPKDRAVYLYCTCAHQASSARVARELVTTLEATVLRIAVIRGGLRAWTRAGLAVEAVPADDIAAMPGFK